MANGSDFIKNWLETQNAIAQEKADEEAKAADEKATIDRFNTTIKNYIKGYTDWAKKNNGKYAGAKSEDLDARVRKLVKIAGESDGSIDDNSTEADIARFGTAFLNTMSGLKEDGSEYKFKDYLDEYGNEETKEAAKRQIKGAAAQAYLDKMGDYGGFDNGRTSEARSVAELAKNRSEGDYKWLNTSRTQYDTWKETHARDLYGLFDNYDDESKQMTKKEKEASDGEKTQKLKEAEGTLKPADTSETTGEEVTFTLPKANDPNYRGFGQKIVDLGLATSKGLWGSDGDVAFYTKQLYDQGALDGNGNLKIGVPIKLKKRKVNK